jgi:hypothetical protein
VYSDKLMEGDIKLIYVLLAQCLSCDTKLKHAIYVYFPAVFWLGISYFLQHMKLLTLLMIIENGGMLHV